MITCDTREPRPNSAKPKSPDIAKLIQERGVPAEYHMLEVGDYQMRGRDELVLVTRKSGDLLPSVFSGHFKEEIQKCVNLLKSSGGGKLFFINEGPWATTAGGLGHYKKAGPQFFRLSSTHHSAPAVLPNLQVSLQTAGIFHINTGSIQETADALVAVYQRAQDGWPTNFHKGLKCPELKWSDDSRVARLMALWPHLREETAQLLIERWGGIMSVLEAAERCPEAVLETPGLGKKGLRNLMEVIS